MNATKIKIGSHTPWGPAIDVTEISNDISFVKTSRHGGYKLSRSANAKIPEYMRTPGGWYEEDCEWSKVVIVFQDTFTPHDVEVATATMKNWYPHEYMRLTGEVLTDEESVVLKEKKFKAENANNLIVTSAWGSWHPPVPEGMVGVYASRGATGVDGGYWLVPQDEYTNPFVVDENRHIKFEGKF